ncbi:MarR family winged helix-turn-helix transcriptional regulator [Aquipuribacter nitratireducens]|uniref:MarR family winged helix-turn-helix transcriptional regulator n=1 Tax=Aquipuribacter nitratireducens TaxID=650104 RepID=A0ABW0GSB4_9MICO
MTQERWLDADQQRAWRAWLEGSALLEDALNRDLAAHGLSLSEYDILVQLSETEGRSLRMSELAGLVLHSRSRLTHTVSRMESRGLVRREPCEEDRRGVRCTLTDEGMAALVATAPHHVASVRERLVDRLDRDDFLALGAMMATVRDSLRPGSGRRP